MRHYRVFVQDRGAGLYSGYRDVTARTPTEAAKGCKRPGMPKLHAVLWPPDEAGERWLNKYVNKGQYQTDGAKVKAWGAR